MSNLAFLAGAVAILTIAPTWFGGMAPARSYTTAVRYYTGLTFYMAAVVVGYAVLWALILIGASAVWPGVVPQITLFTLLVVAVVARLPIVATANSWMRRLCHKAVGVPAEAERLAEQLFCADWVAPASVVSDVSLLLQGRGYDPDGDWLSAAQPLRDLWLKTAVLFYQVRRWPDDHRYRDFVRAAGGEFNVLRQRFDQLSLKVPRVMDTVERLGELLPGPRVEAQHVPAAPGQSDDEGRTARRIVTDVLADLGEDIAFFLRNVCLFAARGVLARSLTAPRRSRLLAELGFRLPPVARSSAYVLSLAWCAYFVVFVCSSLSIDKKVMIPTVLVIAMATAIIPKRRFGFANEDLYGRTPWLFVVGAGFASVALWVPTRLVFTLVFSALGVLKVGCRVWYPWLLPSFVTTAAVAFLIQDSRWSRVHASWARRLADGAVLAVAMVGAVFGSLWWLALSNCEQSMSLLEAFDLSTASGFLAGILVPTHFRYRHSASLPGDLTVGSAVCTEPSEMVGA